MTAPTMTNATTECGWCGFPALRWGSHAEWCDRTAAALRALHAPLPCGTPSAAKRHQRNGEPMCEPCRVANNAYKRALYAAAKGAA